MRFCLSFVLCVAVVTPSSAQSLLPKENLPSSRLVSGVNAHRPTTPAHGHYHHHRKQRDPIIDGVLKGAAFGLLTPLFGAGCYDTHITGCMLRGAVTFGAVGGLIDAMHHEHVRPIVDPPPFTPAVRWRIRF